MNLKVTEACVYDCLADFEFQFAVDEKYGTDESPEFETYIGKRPYSELPADSKLLYIAGNHGWELIPVTSPRQIITEAEAN